MKAAEAPNLKCQGTIRGLTTLIAYLAIDKRLRNRQLPPPTLEDLVNAVSKKLEKPVSVRQVQLHLQNMRYHTGLGAFAPIKVSTEWHISNRLVRATYSYERKDYSFIHEITKL